MTTNLTKPISTKLLFAMLIVTIGAEVLLYLTRYSSMASTLYDAMMVSSFFIGLKLHERLRSPDSRPTKRQLTLKVTSSFLLFFIGSSVINIYSANTFDDFNESYDQYVQDYTQMQLYDSPVDEGAAAIPITSFFERIDTISYDLYSDMLAGLEEVWRLAYIILLLVVLKKMFPRRWDHGKRDLFLMSALFLTSILFGIDHTLDTAQPWSIRIGAIVTFGNMGFLFGLILLWTRNLWVTVLVHALYDIMATLSWYYIDYAVELFALVVLGVHLCLLTTEKLNQRRLKEQLSAAELTHTAE
jgi:hypothetical protein